MGKKEPSVFEKQIRKVRRIKNILIVTVVALFLGFNGYIGYSVYSIYSSNDIVTQATTNNATVTLTVTPTDIGRFLFDQLGISTTLGSGEIPLTMLFGGLGGSNDSENSSPESAQEENTETTEGEGGSDNPFAALINMSAFEALADLQNNTAFMEAVQNDTLLAEYNHTQSSFEPLMSGNFSIADLFEKVTLNLVLPITIQNPSYLPLKVGTIRVTLVGNETSIDLINLTFPELAAQATTTINIALSLDLPPALLGGGDQGGDNGTETQTDTSTETTTENTETNNGGGIDMFGGANEIRITLTTSLLFLYPITLQGSINLGGMMGGNNNENTNTETGTP